MARKGRLLLERQARILGEISAPLADLVGDTLLKVLLPTVSKQLERVWHSEEDPAELAILEQLLERCIENARTQLEALGLNASSLMRSWQKGEVHQAALEVDRLGEAQLQKERRGRGMKGPSQKELRALEPLVESFLQESLDDILPEREHCPIDNEEDRDFLIEEEEEPETVSQWERTWESLVETQID